MNTVIIIWMMSKRDICKRQTYQNASISEVFNQSSHRNMLPKSPMSEESFNMSSTGVSLLSRHNESGMKMVETNDTNIQHRRRRKDKQFIVTLLLVSFTMLILTLPLSVQLIVFVFVDPHSSPKAYADWLLMVMTGITISNQSSNRWRGPILKVQSPSWPQPTIVVGSRKA
jgi:hypothetical protein